MTVQEMTDKVIEIEKRDELVIHFAYEPKEQMYGFYVFKDHARLVRRFPVEEISKWHIEDFEAQLERMSDEIWAFVARHRYRKVSQTKEVVE